MGAMASQITGVSSVCLTVSSGADQRKISVSLAFARGIQRWQVDSPHKGPVTRKMFPFDGIIMKILSMDTLYLVMMAKYEASLVSPKIIYVQFWQYCAVCSIHCAVSNRVILIFD